MPKRKSIDSKGLIKAVENGGTQSDIMKKFGLKTSTQLKAAYMNALVAEGKVQPIKGGRSGRKAQKGKQIGVGKRGSIIISAEFVQAMGISAEATFTVRKTKNGIALKSVE
jgi:hypothetical protein